MGLGVSNIFIYLLTKVYYVWRNKSRDKKWNAMTDNEKANYLATTKDEGNKRLISDSPIDYLSGNSIFARFTREGMGGANLVR